MHLLKTLSKYPLLFLYIILLLQIAYFFIVSARPYQIAPAGKTYNILGKNFYYPSMIRQAKDGSWGIKDTHTTGEQPIVFTQLFFVALGKIAALFSMDPVSMYQISRITGTVVSALAAWWFFRKFLSPIFSTVATVMAISVETGPSFASVVTRTINLLAPAWDVHILYERRFALPHHLYGEAFGLLFFGTWFSFFLHTPQTKKDQLFRMGALCIFATISIVTLPSYPIIFTLISIPTLLWWSLQNKKIKPVIQTVIPIGIIFGVISVFFKHEFAKGLPWTVWTLAEKSWMQNTTVLTQYAGTLFLYYPFIFLGILGIFFRRKHFPRTVDFATILSISWLIGPALLVPFSQYSFFPFANFRLLDLHGYIPAGLLSALGIFHLIRLSPTKRVGMTIALASISILTIVSVVLTHQYTKQIYISQENTWSNMYPTVKTWDGVLWSEKLPPNSKVMVREFYGEMLPAFGPLSVFIGGTHGFPDWLQRRDLSLQFFSGQMPQNDAIQLLKQYNITHVFWGPDERAVTQTSSLYPNILTPVYVNTDVTIFTVTY